MRKIVIAICAFAALGAALVLAAGCHGHIVYSERYYAPPPAAPVVVYPAPAPVVIRHVHGHGCGHHYWHGGWYGHVHPYDCHACYAPVVRRRSHVGIYVPPPGVSIRSGGGHGHHHHRSRFRR